MTDLKTQFNNRPFATAAMLIGIVTGLITIVTFGGTAIDTVGKYIVTNSELEESENRIITQIHKEAVVTRNAIIGELLIRKSELVEELEEADTDGAIAKILNDIKELNARIDKIKGVGQ